jgi:hypothetical protein
VHPPLQNAAFPLTELRVPGHLDLTPQARCSTACCHPDTDLHDVQGDPGALVTPEGGL